MTDITSHSLARGPQITSWPAITDIPPIATGEIHIWRLDLDGDNAPESVMSILSARERDRALSINNPPARRTYERTRAAKRLILGGYLGIRPQDLELDVGPLGKPFIAAPDTDLRFNLTHTGGLALLAVTLGMEIGLDAEQVRPRKGLVRIAERMFGAEQADILRDLNKESRQQQFHILWTRLEAGVKTHGGGLFDKDSRETGGLHFTSFVPLPGYQACVALPGEFPTPENWLTISYRI